MKRRLPLTAEKAGRVFRLRQAFMGTQRGECKNGGLIVLPASGGSISIVFQLDTLSSLFCVPKPRTILADVDLQVLLCDWSHMSGGKKKKCKKNQGTGQKIGNGRETRLFPKRADFPTARKSRVSGLTHHIKETIMSTITIDPITRIEGHLAIRLEIESNRVSQAFCSGEMFRGFEVILKGRDPMDAQQITQRICGVCPVSHGIASILAQEAAYKVAPPENGRLMRNLIAGANFIQSHIMHFYLLSAPDFVDVAAITQYQGKDPLLQEIKAWVQSGMASKRIYPLAPFLPRYEGRYIEDAELNIAALRHYFDALEMRSLAHKMGALFAGKLPHAATLIPGGVTERVTSRNIVACESMIGKLRKFVTHAYLRDVAEFATAMPEYAKSGRGCGNFLGYGGFPESANRSVTLFPAGVIIDGKPAYFDPEKIREDVRYSLYSGPSGLRPARGQTFPDPEKYDAYSWLKAPRYGGKVMEVGPVARMILAYLKGENAEARPMMDTFFKHTGKKEGDAPWAFSELAEHLNSVMGRHIARALECQLIADRCVAWVRGLKPGKPVFTDFDIPKTAQGVGLTEAPRGALGHWLDIANHKIGNYQCVVPTTWNCSPRDDLGHPGTVELALVGTPIAAARVVRSFDPCIACAVH